MTDEDRPAGSDESEAPAGQRPASGGVTAVHVTTSALWSALATAVAVPALLISTILLARVLGAAGLGRLALYTFWISLCSGLIDLGIPFAIQRKGAIEAGRGSIDGVVAYSRAAATLSLLQVAPMAVVGFVVLPGSASFAIFVVALVAWYPFKAAGYYLGMLSLLKLPSQVRAGSTVLSAAATVVVAMTTRRADLTFASGFFFLNAFEAILLMGVPAGIRHQVLRPGPFLLTRRDLLFAVSDVLGGQLDAIVFQQSEVAFFGSRQAVARGQYSVAQTIGARSTLLLDSLLGPIGVGLMNAWGRGEQAMHQAFRLASDAIALLYLMTCPAGFAVIAVLAEPVFGNSFNHVALFGVIMTAASLVQTSYGPIIGMCSARRRIWPLLASTACAACIDLTLAALLIRPFGLAGAVTSAVAAQAIYAISLICLLGRKSADRSVAGRHALRSVLVVAYCLVPAAATMPMSRTLAYAVVVPAVVVWTLLGLRIPALRGTSRLGEIASHLPEKAQRLLSRPSALRLVDGNASVDAFVQQR